MRVDSLGNYISGHCFVKARSVSASMDNIPNSATVHPMAEARETSICILAALCLIFYSANVYIVGTKHWL